MIMEKREWYGVVAIALAIAIGFLIGNVGQKTDKEIAKDYVETLFTSDTGRFSRYLSKIEHNCTPVTCTMNFLDHAGNSEYIEAYKKYCTENCMENMGEMHLFTYLDYLAYISGKEVSVENVKLIELDAEGEGCYVFVAELKDFADSQYSVQGKLYMLTNGERKKVNAIVFSDATALSIYVAGYDVMNE